MFSVNLQYFTSYTNKISFTFTHLFCMTQDQHIQYKPMKLHMKVKTKKTQYKFSSWTQYT